MKWQSERLKRCQDEYGVYFYNDYSGYGMMECVDNILLALDKELSKKRVNSAALWALVEGLGLFFGCGENVNEWYMCDDGDGVTDRIEMLGVGLLTMIQKLLENDFSRAPAEGTALEWENALITLGLWLVFANDWDAVGGGDGSAGWTTRLVELAELMGIDGEACGVESVKEAWREVKDAMREKEEEGDEGKGGEEDQDEGEGESRGEGKTKGTKEEMSHEEKAAQIKAGTFDRDENGERVWREWCWPLEVGDVSFSSYPFFVWLADADTRKCRTRQFPPFKKANATEQFGRLKFGGKHYVVTNLSGRELFNARLRGGEPSSSCDEWTTTDDEEEDHEGRDGDMRVFE
jgi:hypothetical protein